jgi:hypothetical protein
MLETRGIAQIAEKREAMTPGIFLRGRGADQGSSLYTAERWRGTGKESVFEDGSAGGLHQLGSAIGCLGRVSFDRDDIVGCRRCASAASWSAAT